MQRRNCQTSHAQTGETFPLRRGTVFGYFSELLIEVNLSLRLVPSPLTTAMMASEMPAAIRPYSIAVAPESSARNFANKRLEPVFRLDFRARHPTARLPML